MALISIIAGMLMATGFAVGSGQAPEPVVYYDMTPLFALDLTDPVQRRRFWDETHLVVSLQGLVNRTRPRLFIRYVKEPDDFWWGEMTRRGAWLAGRHVERISSLQALLGRYRGSYKGAVVWDERVPATSNLASTIAGCDDLVCLRYDPAEGSVYRRVTALGVKEAVRLIAPDGTPMFTGHGMIPGTALESTGSAKCDSYRWLVVRYLKTGKADPRVMGYYLDGFWLNCWNAGAPENHTLTNQDWVIAHRGLVFDLGMWDDESPVDDPGQKPGADADTLRKILRAAYDRFHGDGVIHVAGFVPWGYKYTDFRTPAWFAGGKHSGVPAEWKYAEILSCFNAYMDADALGLSAMANASFYQHYPLKARYPQARRPTRQSLMARGILDQQGHIVPRRYVAHYVGDYDSAAWLYRELPRMWRDLARGTVPLSWAFNPNLAARFPMGMAWARERATPNDWFVAGDSGAGYLNPGLLTPPRGHSNLPSGVAAWEKHCAALYRRWDITLTGFVIDGNGPGLAPEGMDAYARFSPDGIVAQKIGALGVHRGMPYIRMRADLPHSPEEAARAIVHYADGTTPRFLVCRSILKQPSWYQSVNQEVARLAGDEVKVVDLYTLLCLVKEHAAEGHRGAVARKVDALSARPGAYQGIAPTWNDDGAFEDVVSSGSRCWSLSGGSRYLYFDADDAFRPGGPVAVEIEYLDDGHGPITLQYDSTDPSAPMDGVYKAAETVERAVSGQWRTAVFHLPDALFHGRQNAGADLRLYVPDGRIQVRAIRVHRPRRG